MRVIKPEFERNFKEVERYGNCRIFHGKNEKRYFYLGDEMIGNFGFYTKTGEDLSLLLEDGGKTLRIYKNGKSYLLIYIDRIKKGMDKETK